MTTTQRGAATIRIWEDSLKCYRNLFKDKAAAAPQTRIDNWFKTRFPSNLGNEDINVNISDNTVVPVTL